MRSGIDQASHLARDARAKWSRVLCAIGAIGILFSGAIAFGAIPVVSPVAASPEIFPETPVTAMDAGTEVANNSPSLVADPTNAEFVVMPNRLDSPDFGCSLQVSGDGGHNWNTAQPVPTLPSGAEKCYAPEAAFDANGTLHYVFVGLAGGGNEPMGAFLTTSKDRGRSFSPPRQVLGPFAFGLRMAIDAEYGEHGRIHLVWLQATSDPPAGSLGPPPNPIMSAHSDDGGRSFSLPVQVSDNTRQRVAAPVLALAPDHAVHVGYFDLQDDIRDYQGLEGPVWEGDWSLVMSTSHDAGMRFSPGVVIEEEVVPFERVMLIFTMPPASLVADDERVCAAWGDGRNGDADVVLRCSQDGGRTWAPGRRLNDDRRGNQRVQYLPRLAISSTGRLDAIFYDRRSDPRNVLNEVFYTYSTDGGRSFSSNIRLTRDSFESRTGQRYTNASAQGLVEFGSRLALLSRPDGAVAAWTDTRNSSLLTGRTGQDIFATSIHFSPARPALLTRALVVGLMVFGVVGVALGIVRIRRGRADRPIADGIQTEPARRWPRIGITLLGLSVVAVVLVAARTPEPEEGWLPTAPPVVEATMQENAFGLDSSVPSGRVVFEVRNIGRLPHRLVVVPFSDDMPPIKDLIEDKQTTVIQPFAAVRAQPPGGRGTFAADLRPDTRYAMVCLVRDADNRTHADKGMFAEFRTTGDAMPNSDPKAGT